MKIRNKLLAAMTALVATAFLYVGCTPEQVNIVAQQAGMASVVVWISVDNPTVNQKVSVISTIQFIKNNATQAIPETTYYVALSPVVNSYITQHVSPQSQPMAMLASGWVLTGIDTFFAMYPDYASNSATATKVVSSFCDGAIAGLSLTNDSLVLEAAMQGAKKRAQVRKAIL